LAGGAISLANGANSACYILSMNPLLKVLVPQLARPRGVLARLIAPMLDRGNHTINLHALAALDLRPRARVLELGFGGGVGLALAIAHEPTLALAGIDPSAEMVERCAKRFGSKVSVALGSVENLPVEAASYDKVYGVNVVYFWPDLDQAWREIQRVLAPGGTLVLGVRPKEILQRLHFDEAGHRVWNPTQYAESLANAGFVEVQARRVPDPAGAWVVSARRP
jgi:arsenite methyltransferase